MPPKESRPSFRLLLGDCLLTLPTLEANSIDSIVTDPPAGIAFMGKAWDGDKGGRAQWLAWLAAVMRECLRVLKPGGHALVWALPRTSHWTATAIEDAGFEIRDKLYHCFGSGFPKSANVSKMIDKAAVTTDAAKQWEGWGTALKPAIEEWVLARKPLSESTVAANVLKWGTGALNIEACRVKTQDSLKGGAYAKDGSARHDGDENWRYKIGGAGEFKQPQGRWPAQLLHDGSPQVLSLFPETTSGGGDRGNKPERGFGKGMRGDGIARSFEASTGSAARFFQECPPDEEVPEEPSAARLYYTAKASGSDKGNEVKGALPLFAVEEETFTNSHPTVKPLALLRYLMRLITPPGGTVLDCFLGSGSGAVAALQEGFGLVGIEKEEEYLALAQTRLAAALRGAP